jgi:hypothetical protein
MLHGADPHLYCSVAVLSTHRSATMNDAKHRHDINCWLNLQITALLQELEAMQATAPGGKSLVYSSWPRFLKLIAEALKAKGITFALAQGYGARRAQQIATFRRTEDSRSPPSGELRTAMCCSWTPFASTAMLLV